ncbi:Bifunctional solanapyrone synthase [Apiospora phragmitis]|uniref:Bifunctional solanapyrone synthase n=1 Tax=Apiospora phragmitis TaxID=2905665 RepID=A0ABR1TNG1_9PEZI
MTVQCQALVDTGLGDNILFPSTPGSGYQASLDSYYSLDVREIKPACVFQPRTADDVSKAIRVLWKPLSGNVAVRGGGHSIWPNNNVAGGVTIDLSLLNQTEVHQPNEPNRAPIASVGAGSRWASALLEIEKYGLSITAGRVGTVGVAGLTLGGGLSFHSGRRGFACDDVTNFEVVLATGHIVNANDEENADLFKALKGGSGNFGIVTRFDFAAFTAGDLYGGMVTAAWDQKDTIVESFIRLIDINEQNPADSQIVLYMYDPANRTSTVSSVLVNTDGITNSTSFEPMAEVPWLADGRATQTYGELVAAMSDERGDRYVWFSLCFQNNKLVIDKATELWETLIDETQDALGDVDRLIFVFQQLPRHYAQKNPGGNVLGMDESLTEDAIVWLGEAFARTPEAEALFQRRIGAITEELEAYAEAIDAATQWRYINYVNEKQDPIKSYGAEVRSPQSSIPPVVRVLLTMIFAKQNIAFMKQVSAKYDQWGFFQTRVPGGFKISHVE